MEKDIINLVRMVQSGDKDAFMEILDAYQPMIKKIVRLYYRDDLSDSAEIEDLKQEASIALYKAANTFNAEQNNISFGLYAKKCVRNGIISALRKLKIRKKKSDEDEYLSLPDPLDRIIEKEDCDILENRIKNELSEYEKAVYELYVVGNSNREIAITIGRSEKSVSNAVCRIKGKLEKTFR